MATVTDYLRLFNRKERYHLLKWALGGFGPGPEFREVIRSRLRLELPNDPKQSFMAMDYHLNWIYAALALANEGAVGERYDNIACEIEGKASRVIEGNQEDVDLLVAFESGGVTELVMVEAKLDSPWSTTQVRRKAQRLRTIFQIANTRNLARPHFVLVSPNKPGGMQNMLDEWFTWLQPSVLTHIPFQGDAERWDVTRCDSKGLQWTTRKIYSPQPTKHD
jgi:hypothetical protein